MQQHSINSTQTCALAEASLSPAKLFTNLTPDVKPIADKSRRYSWDDRAFIKEEVNKLLSAGIIEECNSPWRAQVVVTRDERHKKRLVIDYSQTINRFTIPDAYPIPRIDDMVLELSKFSVFSTLDLKSAYHQIPLADKDKPFTAFEADGKLFQFKRLPFGPTNAVAAFQRKMNELIKTENLEGTFAYLDNLTVGGFCEKDHDDKLPRLLEAAARYNLTFNHDKSILRTDSITLLGYEVSQGCLRPDPHRLQPLRDLKPPSTIKSLQRCLGMFGYYAQWIPQFADKIYPLSHSTSFPLSQEALQAFQALKIELEKASLQSIEEHVPFVVETDASDVALSASLNQNGRLVALMSKALSASELKYSAVEKEAQAIIEAVRKWSHLLSTRHFTLITDQRSVSSLFDATKHSKIKNDKIQRWRMELLAFNYDIKYRPGNKNTVADAFSRVSCALSSISSIQSLHESLCHPGVTRLYHFIRSRNLPFSLEEVRKVCSSCPICSELKPQFFKAEDRTLIKATQPFERLCVDFKGPLPKGASNNSYMLTVVDEYSRFPFAFPCKDMTSETIIRCFNELFSLFGMPSYVHSDRGPSFMTLRLRTYLTERGISMSRTTPYNPQGNGQCERFNSIIWNAVKLALKSRQMELNQWELVLPDALHSIRSLLSTATNETPHERIFLHKRKSSFGSSFPSWLLKPGPVFLRRFIRNSKDDPLVTKVNLVEANSQFARIQYPDGRDSTVSLRDLAPYSSPSKDFVSDDSTSEMNEDRIYFNSRNDCVDEDPDGCTVDPPTESQEGIVPVCDNQGREVSCLRRSQRVRRPPQKLDL